MDNRITSYPRVAPVPASPREIPKPGAGAGPSFQSILQKQLDQEPLKFSAHAQQRLEMSRTSLTDGDLARINDAVQKAASKGARESLILMDNLALVVSVKNRTVITAVDGQRMKENIFTNIDSAVIL